MKQNVDRRMKIGSDMFNFFVYYKNYDDTSKRVLNLDEQLQQIYVRSKQGNTATMTTHSQHT